MKSAHCIREFAFTLSDHLEGLFLVGDQKTAFVAVGSHICQSIDTADGSIRNCYVLLLNRMDTSVIDNLGLIVGH
jgi:hypothetical protein